MDAEQLLHDLELANENLELSDNQLETLRAENEALKVDNENTNALWSEALELLGGKVQEVEAKDAQIRGLVEALDKAGNFIEDEYLNTNCQTSLKTEKQLEEIDKALATIPAEALELAKLEREIHEKLKDISNDWDGSTVSWSKLMDLIKAYESYEARKEAHQDV